MKIRDIIMYLTAFPGLALLCYVRLNYMNRIKLHPDQVDYTEKEAKLRKLAIILMVIGVALALIPAKYAF